MFYLTFVRVEVAVNVNCIGKRDCTGFVYKWATLKTKLSMHNLKYKEDKLFPG